MITLMLWLCSLPGTGISPNMSVAKMGFWHQYERIGSIRSTVSAVAQCARAVNPHSDPQKHPVKLMCFVQSLSETYTFWDKCSPLSAKIVDCFQKPSVFSALFLSCPTFLHVIFEVFGLSLTKPQFYQHPRPPLDDKPLFYHHPRPPFDDKPLFYHLYACA